MVVNEKTPLRSVFPFTSIAPTHAAVASVAIVVDAQSSIAFVVAALSLLAIVVDAKPICYL
jgi:hypothetical protein